jgi:hypothetical protein
LVGAAPTGPDLEALGATHGEWDRLLWLANWHALLPTVHSWLGPTAPALAPPDIARALATAAEANQLSLLARQREALLLIGRLETAHSPVVLGSGWALGQRYQPRAAARQVGSALTLWLRRSQLPVAERVAADAGYEVADGPLRLISKTHSRLALRALPENHPLWSDNSPLDLAGRSLAVPSAASWLVLWFAEGNLPGPRRLRAASDLVTLAAQITDWPSVFATAAHFRRRRALLFGLGVSYALLELDPPPPLADALAATTLATPLASWVADVWNRPTRRLTPLEIACLEVRLAEGIEPRLRAMGRAVRLIGRAGKPPATGRSLGRYAPTPRSVVERLVSFAPIGPDDVVYDLGCGDGRIVIASAQAGARGTGIDLDPARIAEAQAAAAAAGVTARVEWRCADVWSVDLSAATVVTIYLQGFAYPRLRKKLLRELRPGTRVLSHDFIFPDWPPERSALVLAHPAKISLLHLWRVPGAAAH